MSLHLGAHVLSSEEKQVIDLASILTVVGTLSEHLPSIAAALTIVWTGLRIWEMETVQRWFKKKPKPEKE